MKVESRIDFALQVLAGSIMLQKCALTLILWYQKYLSPLTPPACRFTPTCSHYTYEAISRFGIWRGGWLGFKRLLRCQPFCKGGFDPVPLPDEVACEVAHEAKKSESNEGETSVSPVKSILKVSDE